ncbi:SH3 domain-containing protein [Ruminococcus flavefaciens]|uniref:SH3 domain-containing protein n=1 Tax=Ruminococcus flavefaciens TaxID=1265 RepID=UPI00037CED7B|nr:SH3 domain-containing protein [Ruminococcus flavefaciens]
MWSIRSTDLKFIKKELIPMNKHFRKILCTALSAAALSACVVMPSAINDPASRCSVVNSVEANAKTIAVKFKIFTKRQVTAKSGLNIREGAGTNYRVVGALNYGEQIITMGNDNGWGYIPGRGWIYLYYTIEI